MIEKARINANKLGLNNVEFRLGEIEKLPMEENIADVVVSNCVLNLVPDKKKAFAETYRVLKPGGILVYQMWYLLATYLKVCKKQQRCMQVVYQEQLTKMLT